jgi:hypothetical protein
MTWSYAQHQATKSADQLPHTYVFYFTFQQTLWRWQHQHANEVVSIQGSAEFGMPTQPQARPCYNTKEIECHTTDNTQRAPLQTEQDLPGFECVDKDQRRFSSNLQLIETGFKDIELDPSSESTSKQEEQASEHCHGIDLVSHRSNRG